MKKLITEVKKQRLYTYVYSFINNLTLEKSIDRNFYYSDNGLLMTFVEGTLYLNKMSTMKEFKNIITTDNRMEIEYLLDCALEDLFKPKYIRYYNK